MKRSVELLPKIFGGIATCDDPSHAHDHKPDGYSWPHEPLPFTVRLVRDNDDLGKAVHIRHTAYARHLPGFAMTLENAEQEDTENGVAVLLAESKLDGSPLGTMRISTNQFKPLAVEQSVDLPDWMHGKRLAEATRLGVTDGAGGRLVTTVLFKSFYLYCKRAGVQWMVVTGRSPIDRQYERLLYSDVFPGAGFIPLRHVGNLPHRVMCTETASCETRWAAAKHPLFEFAFRTFHPDIHLADCHPSGAPTCGVAVNWAAGQATSRVLM